jgi:hypothetical protein
VELYFARSARKHRIGKASMLHVINSAEPTITNNDGDITYWWEGVDERGRELEIGAFLGADGRTIVHHAMPLKFRRKE